MILLFFIIFALLVYLVFFAAQFINVLGKGYPPFISTDRETVARIIGDLKIKEGATVYELGCGRAGFLRQAEKTWPGVRLIGVENILSLYGLVKLELLGRRSRIKLLRKDFFSLDLKDADLIYCYLNNMVMAKLGQKFRQECRSGTQIISRSFPIPEWAPEKTLRLRNKNIYFYKL